ncbi:hypothetical protein VTO73DRAFT_453 [Trametes versicolor]
MCNLGEISSACQSPGSNPTGCFVWSPSTAHSGPRTKWTEMVVLVQNRPKVSVPDLENGCSDLRRSPVAEPCETTFRAGARGVMQPSQWSPGRPKPAPTADFAMANGFVSLPTVSYHMSAIPPRGIQAPGHPAQHMHLQNASRVARRTSRAANGSAKRSTCGSEQGSERAGRAGKWIVMEAPLRLS